MDPARVAEIARLSGLSFLGDPPIVDGSDPVLNYPVPVGEASAVAHALQCDAAGALATARHLRFAPGAVAVRHAAAALASFALLRLDGAPEVPEQWEREAGGRYRPWGAEAVLRGENAGNPVVAFHSCRDGRSIHLHGGTPRLGRRIRDVLGGDGVDVAAAVASWTSWALEDAIAEAGSCAAVARTPEEWRRHPQGLAIADVGPCQIERVADGPALVLTATDALPLSGIRVLDIGEGLAGPTSSQALARYGAEVLQVVSPSRPTVEPFLLDTGHGKRSAFLDLSTQEGRAVFARLVTGADVLCQSFRSGVLEQLGFDAETLRSLSPGLVKVSINCYGPRGPWSGRRGWEQLGQVATGLSLATSTDGMPRLAPAAVCDYLTGHLAAAGAMRALAARIGDGGAWEVRASLCQTGDWLGRFHRVTDSAPPASVPSFTDLLLPERRGCTTVIHVPPVVRSASLPLTWPSPAPVRGGDRPAWTSVRQGEVLA